MIDQRTVNIPGARLMLHMQGSGQDVALLHGFAGDRGLWDGFWPDLARHHRAIRYDLRGFGQSEALTQAPYRHARDLVALLDTLGVETCSLVGVSMGGAIALNFALEHPDRVRRLVLVSPGIAAWEWSEAWRSGWEKIVEAARHGSLEEARELWWRHPLFETTRAIPEAAAKLRESIEAYSGSHWAHGDNEEPAMPDVDRLSELAPETLLLTGSEDLPDFRLIADLIEAVAPNLRRIDYEGAGHMLHLERPEAFAADVTRFLATGSA